MSDDVMDFNLSLWTERETLFAEAACPLGESYGTSPRPHQGELVPGDRAVGERLLGCLLPGAVRSLYHRCRGRLTARGTLRLRIRARAKASAHDLVRIHAIPWELAYDPHGDGFLALDPQVQLVRYLNILTAVPDTSLLGGRELDVLLVIASPKDQGRLRWETEREEIERAFAGSAARLTILSRATRGRLFDALVTGAHDVLHFIGHGAGPDEVRPGRLVLESETGGSDWISARELAVMARASSSLRLVFLNACSTAEFAARSHLNLAASVGPSLALRGVPAVVAMATAVEDDDAVAFARGVYARLGDGASLDVAVHAGRIATRLGQRRGRAWAIPVVFSRMASTPAAEPRAGDERSSYALATRLDELRADKIEIAARVREPGTAVDAGERVRVDVDAGRIIGQTVTIGGIVDRRGDGRGRR